MKNHGLDGMDVQMTGSMVVAEDLHMQFKFMLVFKIVLLISDTEFTFTIPGEPGIHIFDVPTLSRSVLVSGELMVCIFKYLKAFRYSKQLS